MHILRTVHRDNPFLEVQGIGLVVTMRHQAVYPQIAQVVVVYPHLLIVARAVTDTVIKWNVTVYFVAIDIHKIAIRIYPGLAVATEDAIQGRIRILFAILRLFDDVFDTYRMFFSRIGIVIILIHFAGDRAVYNIFGYVDRGFVFHPYIGPGFAPVAPVVHHQDLHGYRSAGILTGEGYRVAPATTNLFVDIQLIPDAIGLIRRGQSGNRKG